MFYSHFLVLPTLQIRKIILTKNWLSIANDNFLNCKLWDIVITAQQKKNCKNSRKGIEKGFGQKKSFGSHINDCEYDRWMSKPPNYFFYLFTHKKNNFIGI